LLLMVSSSAEVTVIKNGSSKFYEATKFSTHSAVKRSCTKNR